MSPSRQINDEAIEAVIRGERVDERFEPLVTFAHHVRAAGGQPVPRASAELVALLEGTEPVVLRPVDPVAPRPLGPGRSRRSERRKRVPFASALAAATTKVAGFGMLTKLGLGSTMALSGVTAAGAAGVMPDPATNAVRDAIEVVTPVEFPDDAGGQVGVTTRGTAGDTGTGTDTEVDGGGGGQIVVDPDPANPSVEVNGGLGLDGGLPPVTVPPVPTEVPGLPGVTLPPEIPTTLPELPVELPQP